MTTRRLVLTRSAAVIGAASSGLLLPQIVRAQSDKIRVGFMLPYTGTFAQLGVAIENGVRMALNEQGGKLGGREVEFFKVDDESNPAKGIENATRLVQRDKVDVLIGTVHSGVQMGIHKVARESGVPQTICWNVLNNRRYRCGEATLEKLTAYLFPLATERIGDETA